MGGQVSASGSFHSLPCTMDNADWMSALCPGLWDVPLHHLSIPGEPVPPKGSMGWWETHCHTRVHMDVALSSLLWLVHTMRAWKALGARAPPHLGGLEWGINPHLHPETSQRKRQRGL